MYPHDTRSQTLQQHATSGSGDRVADVQAALAEGLDDLRGNFPQFRIWQEVMGDRTRYVARRLDAGAGPHTVVTADLAELRAVLEDAPASPGQPGGRPADTSAPNVARIYNRWLGGKDNFETDRLAADAVMAEFPEITQVARANREFVTRAVAYTAAQGITQFMDIGTGLPTAPSIHHVARHADPAARVAYIDNDPIVLAHVRALLATGPGVAVTGGDMRQPAAILASPDLRAIIDLDQPVCVILAAVLHFVLAGQADAIVAAFTTAMAPGSYLILSAGTSTGTSPALINRLTAAYAGTTVVTGRTTDEIAGYFTGLHLVPPGLTDVWAWRPDHQRYWPPLGSGRILGAVGRKPATSAEATVQQRGQGVAV